MSDKGLEAKAHAEYANQMGRSARDILKEIREIHARNSDLPADDRARLTELYGELEKLEKRAAGLVAA